MAKHCKFLCSITRQFLGLYSIRLGPKNSRMGISCIKNHVTRTSVYYVLICWNPTYICTYKSISFATLVRLHYISGRLCRERERATFFFRQAKNTPLCSTYIYYVVCTASRKGIEADAKNVGRKTVRKKSTVYTIQYKTVRKKNSSNQ